MFGWGTSGYNHGAVCYQPWSTDSHYAYYYAYGQYNYNLYDHTGQADWGCNQIINGGNQLNQWRTLTGDDNGEWRYVFLWRNTASGIRYAMACVNNVNGVILLPDDWSINYFSLNNANDSWASCSSNTITAAQWGILEQHGAVFLPITGDRNGTSISHVDTQGYYWSATYNETNEMLANSLAFGQGGLFGFFPRNYGLSVRLVHDY